MLSVPHIHIEICLNQSMWDDVSTLILFILMHNCYSNLVWKWFEFNCCIYAIKWNDIKRQYGSFEHLKWFLFFFFLLVQYKLHMGGVYLWFWVHLVSLTQSLTHSSYHAINNRVARQQQRKCEKLATRFFHVSIFRFEFVSNSLLNGRSFSRWKCAIAKVTNNWLWLFTQCDN